jgi:hypothetical protein
MRICAIVFFTILCAVMFVSCPAPGGSHELPDHYILFYIDGQRCLFDKGLTDVETEAFAGHWGATHTTIFATPDTGKVEDFNNLNLSSFIKVGIEDWYDIGNDTPGNTGDIILEFLDYYDGATDTLYQLKFNINTPDTATVTSNASVGGDITGTFSGTVVSGGQELEVTSGSFKVKRVDRDFQ